MDPTKKALLSAILAKPREDTARLVYSDWLEEHEPDVDVSRATVEFIRLSCRPGKPSKQMPPAAYAWLEDNWRRLVPSLVALHIGAVPDRRVPNLLHSEFETAWATRRTAYREGDLYWARLGRLVEFSGILTHQTEVGPRICGFLAQIGFWKGFVYTYRAWGTAGTARDLVFADQPIVELGGNRQLLCG